ncbi:GntR family transcriptional regulator [Thalassovita taeanensis]|uniref:Transcriptional regulator, GntR family n=1 Tax=Thalassovita taeanensis TaxID=657014 RepID=A0A1H9CE23_9RHOB|nr:GntR family transcriptional regulator [Thalassovita taeanensis]SEP98908.1 transcriptional regulator, GntR family [Thalassovita taeanensis]
MPDYTQDTDARERFLRLHSALRERICLLDYPPGARLSEEVLAGEFGTSRTPLRRVLARLEDEGLVISRHGVGTLVTDVDIGEMARTYDLRRELAGLVGRLSPVPMTDAILTEARRFADRGRMLQTAPDAREFARMNMEYFHFGAALTTNEALRETSERLYYRTARIWLKSIPRMDLHAEVAIFLSELDQNLTAIENGDLMAAALIRQAHISMCFTRLAGG